MECGDGDKPNQNIGRQEEYSVIELDRDPVVASIERMLQKVSSFSSECCIYRVPEPLRSVNPKAYTPKVISIGPLHYGKRDLMAKAHKRRYLHSFLDRAKMGTQAIIERVKTWEEKARNSYAEPIEMNSDDFVKLILLDGCFVVLYLIGFKFPELRDVDKSFLWRFGTGIFCDLVLLENQLPFFVLQGLYDLCSPFEPLLQGVSLIKLTRDYLSAKGLVSLSRHVSIDSKVNHFVDFLRIHLVHSCYSRCPEGDTTMRHSFWPPTATELHECGVSFRKMKGKCVMDITFTELGVLDIPKIHIYDNFEIFIRNIIAFEQCHGSHLLSHDVSNFATFLHCLINTDKDLSLLIDDGIILNNLGSIKEVRNIFNNLCKHVSLGSNFYNGECIKMKAYCKRRRHRWMTSLRRDYFNTPWAFISFIAAVFLLVLTLMQTIMAIISTYQ